MSRPGRPQPGIGLPGGFSLRRWTPSDAPALFSAHQEPLVRHYSGLLLDDQAQALSTVQRYTSTWELGEGAAWAVSDAGGSVLGSLRFGLTDRTLGVGSVGYWLLPELRGRGLATLSVRQGSRIVFDRLGWHRIELCHSGENERSCAVARRSGYPLEGVKRQAAQLGPDGRRSDEHLHARLAGDPEPAG